MDGGEKVVARAWGEGRVKVEGRATRKCLNERSRHTLLAYGFLRVSNVCLLPLCYEALRLKPCLKFKV